MYERILKTIITVFIATHAWRLMELVAYGQVQTRVVDNAMMLFFIPFIFNSYRE